MPVSPTRVPSPRWASSPPMRDLVAAFGGTLPDLGAGALLAWLDDFSAEHWDFRSARQVERHHVVAPSAAQNERSGAEGTHIHTTQAGRGGENQ
ncbi:hypothetical protein ACWKSP_14760 [Micromonosporaceae bacterium Da 78-11]